VELADWLRESSCTHEAMESTGIYWKPVWHVPDRKTEMNDATWIDELLPMG
jgi:hypothetical protein